MAFLFLSRHCATVSDNYLSLFLSLFLSLLHAHIMIRASLIARKKRFCEITRRSRSANTERSAYYVVPVRAVTEMARDTLTLCRYSEDRRARESTPFKQKLPRNITMRCEIKYHVRSRFCYLNLLSKFFECFSTN